MSWSWKDYEKQFGNSPGPGDAPHAPEAAGRLDEPEADNAVRGPAALDSARRLADRVRRDGEGA